MRSGARSITGADLLKISEDSVDPGKVVKRVQRNVKKNQRNEYPIMRKFFKYSLGTVYNDFFKGASVGDFGSSAVKYHADEGIFSYNLPNGRVFVDVLATEKGYQKITKFLEVAGIREKKTKSVVSTNTEVLWKKIGKAEKRKLLQQYVTRFSKDKELCNSLAKQLIMATRTGAIESKNISLEGHFIDDIQGVRYSKSGACLQFDKNVKTVEPVFIRALPSINDTMKKKSRKAASNRVEKYKKTQLERGKKSRKKS